MPHRDERITENLRCLSVAAYPHEQYFHTEGEQAISHILRVSDCQGKMQKRQKLSKSQRRTHSFAVREAEEDVSVREESSKGSSEERFMGTVRFNYDKRRRRPSRRELFFGGQKASGGGGVGGVGGFE